jgi:hypothetical protein
MEAQIKFLILALYQLEKMKNKQICDYFEYQLQMEYITELIDIANSNDKYFVEILLNYLVC